MASSTQIRVTTWNILANKCADTSPMGFPFVSPEVLEWEFRKPLILEHLKSCNSDVIALQEVDKMDEIRQALEQEGYETFSDLDNVLAWKKEKWRCRLFHTTRFSDSGQGMIMVQLVSVESDSRHVSVATTHLKAKEEYARVRMRQAGELLWHLGGCEPLILAGDFNCPPTEKTYEKVRKVFLSAYVDRYDSHYTTCKSRSEGVVTLRTIDYIFYKGLSLETRVSVPPAPAFPYWPSPSWPSDHHSLTASFHL